MKSILLVNESQFNNKAGVEVLANLRSFEYVGRNDDSIKVLTNLEFITANPYIKAFNQYLKRLRETGVVSIIITLYK